MPNPSISMRVEGLSDLEKALTELPKATGKNVIRRALLAAAQPISDEAIRRIRVKRVEPKIGITPIKFTSGSAGKRAFAEAMARGATRQEASDAAHVANARESGEAANTTSGVTSIGPTQRAFYGFEFGTVKQAPQPFMRPAWDLHKMQALETIKTALAEEIEKARIRIVQKQLRLLAKLNK